MATSPLPLLADRFAPGPEAGRSRSRTPVTFEIRVTPWARLDFRRYRRVSTPAASVIGRAVLHTVKHNGRATGARH